MTNINSKKEVFKYNMSFYYQSTIVYFIVFIIYMIIRGEFFEGSFRLFTNDPIIYFFGIIVLFSIVSLLYNLYKQKHLEISAEGLAFISRFKSKKIGTSDIEAIRFPKKKGRTKSKPFRLIRIKLKTRKRPVIIRPSDYEKEDELIKRFHELKNDLERI